MAEIVSKDTVNKSKWSYSFKKLLVVYFVAIAVITLLWSNYMERNHNAKAWKFSWKNLTNNDLIELSLLTHTTKLELNSANVNNVGLVHLKSLTKLTELSLGHTKIDDRGLMHLKSFANLTKLCLQGAPKINGSGLAYLKPLTILVLKATNIKDNRLVYLKSLTNLIELYLSDTKISEIVA